MRTSKRSRRYQKPKIKVEKIKLNFFLSRKTKFNNMDLLLAVNKSPGYCFLPEVKVILSNGISKEIQYINENDTVLSYDLTSARPCRAKVKRLIIHKNISFDYLIINKNIKTTLDHPFYIIDVGWKKASQLRRGDVLLNDRGESVFIKSIFYGKRIGNLYNILLSGQKHTYFVEGCLVHNALFPVEDSVRLQKKDDPVLAAGF